MPINRERLEQRKEELKLQLEQSKQQFIALTGAIQNLEYLLAEKEESISETDKDKQ